MDKNKLHQFDDIGFNCHKEYDIITILTHELGHVLLGQYHSSNINDIMFYKINYCEVKLPSELEIKTLN